MKRPPGMKPFQQPTARQTLQNDVADLLHDAVGVLSPQERGQLAHEIITIVRERVLREIESYARQNVR